MTAVHRDLLLAALIAAAAFGIRTYPAWSAVFGPSGTSFLETDAWYHVRLVENQVRHFPWRVTWDPFAAPHGQFIPIAPMFDTITASVVMVVHGRDATTAEVERVAAFMPPIFGAATIVVVWALARKLFGRRAGLLAAALLAVLPGHFLDRTMLGFVDHHALEALLATSVLLAMADAVDRNFSAWTFVPGVLLGLYLLAWGSGAFLVAILGAWLFLYSALAASTESLSRAAAASGLATVTALLLVVVFQDPAMHRYGSQILSLVGLGVLAAGSYLVVIRPELQRLRKALPALLIVLAGVVAASVALFARELLTQALIDVRRFAPDPSRMGVLEARPLFLFTGSWNWIQPWTFFRTGFFIGLIALVPFAVRVWRRRAPGDLLLLVYALATFAATLGQNRFGYYLVTACALLGGWLASELLDWGGVPHAENRSPQPRTRLPMAREMAVIAVAAGMFAPNLAPRVLLAEKSASYPNYWRSTMDWIRENTPPPFEQPDYYFARYADAPEQPAAYSIMSWWDQGYWIIQQARRVPVANPTQGAAPVAGQFYSATSEADALEILRQQRARYVISDFELPFRRLANGTIMGRFQTIVDWTGADHDRFYEVVYRREGSGWTPVWIFHEPYYGSMAFRLSVLGGQGVSPAEPATVVTLDSRVDSNGLRFRELVNERTYPTYEAATQAVEASGGRLTIVGLDPWRSAFPVERLEMLTHVFDARTPEQKPGEAPWVRVFEVR